MKRQDEIDRRWQAFYDQRAEETGKFRSGYLAKRGLRLTERGEFLLSLFACALIVAGMFLLATVIA